MTTVTCSGIDDVLRQAIDSGAVPNVAAITADRNGIIYEGAFGPRVVGAEAPVSVDTQHNGPQLLVLERRHRQMGSRDRNPEQCSRA